MKVRPLVLLTALTALAAPLAAGAQSLEVGEAELTSEDTDVNYLGRTHCLETSTAEGTLSFRLDADTTTLEANDEFEVWVSTHKPTDGVCPENDTAGGVTSQVVETFRADTVPVSTVEVELSAFPARLGTFGTCEPAFEKRLYACVHWVNASNQLKGAAAATLTMELFPAVTPTNVRVGSSERALRVEWSDPDPGSGEVDAFEYQAIVSGGDLTQEKRSRRSTSRSAIVEGLSNDVTYDVEVVAFSRGNNESARSAKVPGTPAAIDDFWEHYKNGGGTDDGGCATGSAGAGAITGLLLALALRRRRS